MNQSHPWLIFASRFSGDTEDPSREDLIQALREMYVEDHPDLEEGDYEERGSASLRRGFDDGPMVVIEVGRFGSLTLEHWADQDYEVELTSPRTITNADYGFALEAWLKLAHGDIDELRNVFHKGAE